MTFMTPPEVRVDIGSGAEQLAQHKKKNAAMPVVFDLDRRIDPQRDRHFLSFAISSMNHERDVLAWLYSFLQAKDVECRAAIKLQRRCIHAFLKLARQDSHTHQIAAVDAFKTLRDHGLDAEQLCPLRGPVARTARTILLTRDYYKRQALLLIP